MLSWILETQLRLPLRRFVSSQPVTGTAVFLGLKHLSGINETWQKSEYDALHYTIDPGGVANSGVTVDHGHAEEETHAPARGRREAKESTP